MVYITSVDQLLDHLYPLFVIGKRALQQVSVPAVYIVFLAKVVKLHVSTSVHDAQHIVFIQQNVGVIYANLRGIRTTGDSMIQSIQAFPVPQASMDMHTEAGFLLGFCRRLNESVLRFRHFLAASHFTDHTGFAVRTVNAYQQIIQNVLPHFSDAFFLISFGNRTVHITATAGNNIHPRFLGDFPVEADIPAKVESRSICHQIESNFHKSFHLGNSCLPVIQYRIVQHRIGIPGQSAVIGKGHFVVKNTVIQRCYQFPQIAQNVLMGQNPFHL